MKNQSIIKTALFAAGFSAMALIGNAFAAPVINGQIGDNSNSLNGLGSGSTVAPLAYSGTTWNELGVGNTTTALLNSTGGASGVTYSETGFLATQDAAASLTFLQGYSYFAGAPITITLSGLSSAYTYNIVLVGAGSNLDSTVSIPGYGTQQTTYADVPAPSFILDGNYVEFNSVVATGGSVTLTVGPGPGNAPYYAVNGFQIQEVPEPSTYALMGLGALALLVVSRRRRTV